MISPKSSLSARARPDFLGYVPPHPRVLPQATMNIAFGEQNTQQRYLEATPLPFFCPPLFLPFHFFALPFFLPFHFFAPLPLPFASLLLCVSPVFESHARCAQDAKTQRIPRSKPPPIFCPSIFLPPSPSPLRFCFFA